MTSTECPITILEKMYAGVVCETWVNEDAKKHFASGIKISIAKLKHHGFIKEVTAPRPMKPLRLDPNQLDFLPMLRR